MASSAPTGRARAAGLAIEDTGAGRPIVLIHGLATTRMIWREVTPFLARHRRIVAIDVPGFGASPAAGRGFDLDEVATTIADGLAAAGVDEPIDVVGHSMGGAIALRLATLHSGRVRRLVLVAPAGLKPIGAVAAGICGNAAGALVALRRAAAPVAVLRPGRRALLALGVHDPDAIAADDVRDMAQASRGATRVRAAFAAVARADIRADLVATRAPIAAIWGELDRVIPPAGVTSVLAARPDAVVAVVPGTGHIAMMERPRAFAAALDDVLARVSK